MKKTFGFVIVLILSYWMVRPFFSQGFFPMHDDTQVARVIEMGKALRQGQFPVRWVSELGYGYGYPIFNFYGPLPYYVGGVFYALGASGLIATKLMMGLGLVASGITMYIVAADMLGISGGILAAALYMYAPYHAVDAYVRGAVGEYWALVFLPLIFWGFWKKKLLTGAFSIAGMIASHTILGFVGMVFVGLATIIMRRKDIIFMVIIGLSLSAFFWLPAITEMKYTNVASQISSTANFRDHFVCVPQLWNSLWGYGGSARGCLDGFSFKVGKVHLILALVALLAALVKRTRFALAGTSIFLLSVFFMLPMSQLVWEKLPFFAYIQYPWRFLAFALFGISIAGAGIVQVIKKKYFRWVVIGCIVLIVMSIEAKRFVPQYTYSRASSEFETPEDIRFRVSKISDEYLPSAVIRPTKESQVIRDTIPPSDIYTVKFVQNTDTYKKFELLSGADNRVTVNVAYFPGWEYHVNEFTVKPEVHNGLPVLIIPSGFSTVQLKFTDTPVRRIGNIVSMIAVGTCLYLYDRKNKKNIS